MKYYPLDEAAARTAHEANSMREFRSDEPEYRGAVDEAYSLAEEAAQSRPGQREKLNALADRYAEKLAQWYNEKYRIEAMCPSILVSGAGNFPVRRKEKQNAARDRHCEEYRKIEGLKERIRAVADSRETIKCGDDDAIEKLRAKAEALAEKQEQMKAANAQARKEGKPAPYRSYSLSNNRQNLNATRKRLESLEAAKAKGTAERRETFMGEGVRVIENAEAMRLQLVFDEKPTEEARAVLKKSGFRWSPKNGAWQRQLTDNAKRSLRWMMEDAK